MVVVMAVVVVVARIHAVHVHVVAAVVRRVGELAASTGRLCIHIVATVVVVVVHDGV